MTYKKGLPVFGVIIIISAKMLIPHEFSFTHTLASQNILPLFKSVESYSFFKNITIGRIFLYLWVFVTVLLLFLILHKHANLIRILNLVPETKEQEILQQLSILCDKKQIRHRPKVIKLDVDTSPFIIGVRNPILVLPSSPFKKDEIFFIIHHELEHLRNHHLLIKMCLEIVTAIYWWNPLVWLIRRQTICALETQADTYVILELSNKARISYLETLIQLCRGKSKKDTSVALSFSLKNSMVERRILTVLKHDCFQKKVNISITYLIPILLSVTMLLSSFTYTFEVCRRNPLDIKGTFTMNSESDYLKLRTDGKYDVYINKKYVATVTNILDDFSDLPVLK
nr:M56 family metallopeptidase [uncultured Clostridium sp.]